MFTWDFEMWEVRNDGSDPKMPRDTFPRLQQMKLVVRNERGQFHGATNFRHRNTVPKKTPDSGTLSVVGQGLRLVQ